MKSNHRSVIIAIVQKYIVNSIEEKIRTRTDYRQRYIYYIATSIAPTTIYDRVTYTYISRRNRNLNEGRNAVESGRLTILDPLDEKKGDRVPEKQEEPRGPYAFRTICRVFTDRANPVADVTREERKRAVADTISETKGGHHQVYIYVHPTPSLPFPPEIIKSWHISSSRENALCRRVSSTEIPAERLLYEPGTESNVLESPDGPDSKG